MLCQITLSATDIISRRADAYHTCYALAGLSSTQYFNYFIGLNKNEPGSSLDHILQWVSLPKVTRNNINAQESIFNEGDRLTAIHPIYVIPWVNVEQAHKWACKKTGF